MLGGEFAYDPEKWIKDFFSSEEVQKRLSVYEEVDSHY
jgi:hypothetical protein